jgi:hypothetical protein
LNVAVQHDVEMLGFSCADICQTKAPVLPPLTSLVSACGG